MCFRQTVAAPGMLARYGSLRAGRLMWSGVDGAVQACAEDAGPSVHKPT